jgi:hypothetical protein
MGVQFRAFVHTVLKLRFLCNAGNLSNTMRLLGLSYVDLIFFSALRSNADLGLLIHEISRSHTMRHHSR